MIKNVGPFLALGIFLASLFSCANRPMQASLSSLDASEDQLLFEDYQIGPEDVLEILVWKNEALSKTVNVRPDGKISLPLIGDVPAAGLTPGQIKEEISEKLKEYYKDPPHVSVIVQQANSYVIYMLGEVKNPAQYVVKRGTRFLQALALAGGFTPFASTNDILVLRKDTNNHSQSRIPIRYKDIVSGNNLSHNIVLKPGDTIVVP